jgi:hypothetical protein
VNKQNKKRRGPDRASASLLRSASLRTRSASLLRSLGNLLFIINLPREICFLSQKSEGNLLFKSKITGFTQKMKFFFHFPREIRLSQKLPGLLSFFNLKFTSRGKSGLCQKLPGLLKVLACPGWSYEAYPWERRKGQLAARFLASERRREPDLRFPSLAQSEGIGMIRSVGNHSFLFLWCC